MAADTYFVDKTMLIKDLIQAIGKTNRYFCITRPRRFGKSVMADMVGAFFGKGAESAGLFADLKIAKDKCSAAHLNQHNVIFMDCSRIPENCSTYQSYITRISEGLREDLLQA